MSVFISFAKEFFNTLFDPLQKKLRWGVKSQMISWWEEEVKINGVIASESTWRGFPETALVVRTR